MNATQITTVTLSKSAPTISYRRDFLINHPEFNVREVIFLTYLINRIKFHRKQGDISIKGYFRTFELIENDLGYSMSITTLKRMVNKFVELGILAKSIEYNKYKRNMYLKFDDAEILNELNNNKFICFIDSALARKYNIPTAIIYSTLQRLTTQIKNSFLDKETVEYEGGNGYEGWLILDRAELGIETGLTNKEIRNAIDNLTKDKWIDYKAKPKGNSQGLGNMSKFKVL